MYKALIEQVKQLTPNKRVALRELYQRLFSNQPILRTEFSSLIDDFPYIMSENDHIVAAFGLDLRNCTHQLIINGEIRFTWCIWDAFFIAETIAEKAEIHTQDPITGEKISVRWENQVWLGDDKFSCSFPIRSDDKQCSLRSAFCHYVHLFTNIDHGKTYQKTASVEIIPWQTLLKRSQEMTQALTSNEAPCQSMERVLKNLCC